MPRHLVSWNQSENPVDINLEAENHENADIVGTGIPELFSDKNPLFDFSGLRFVNMVEFDIENL